jgi:hypothetical protein
MVIKGGTVLKFALALLFQNESGDAVSLDPPDILLFAALAAAWYLLVRLGGYRWLLPGWVENLRHPARLRLLCWATALFLFVDTAGSYWYGFRAEKWEPDVFLLILGTIVAIEAIVVAVVFLSWGRRVGA